jgi:hypothetical protein
VGSADDADVGDGAVVDQVPDVLLSKRQWHALKKLLGNHYILQYYPNLKFKNTEKSLLLHPLPHRVADPNSFHPDPDPIRIQIQGLND